MSNNRGTNQFNVNYTQIKELISKGSLKCKQCKKVKRLSLFIKRKDAKFGYLYLCKSCHTNRVLKNRQKLSNKNYKEFLKYLLRQNTYFAKVRNIKSSINLEDLISLFEYQKGLCALTKVKMTYRLGQGKTGLNISIDRINSKKGYFNSNIRLSTDVANRSLHNFEDKIIYKHVKLILEKYYNFSL